MKWKNWIFKNIELESVTKNHKKKHFKYKLFCMLNVAGCKKKWIKWKTCIKFDPKSIYSYFFNVVIHYIYCVMQFNSVKTISQYLCVSEERKIARRIWKQKERENRFIVWMKKGTKSVSLWLKTIQKLFRAPSDILNNWLYCFFFKYQRAFAYAQYIDSMCIFWNYTNKKKVTFPSDWNVVVVNA